MCLSLVSNGELPDDLCADPLSGNGQGFLSFTVYICLEWSFTVLLGPEVLFYEVPECSGAYLGYSQQIVLTLD